MINPVSLSKFARGALLATSTAALLAACSIDTDNASQGDTGGVVIGGGGGGGGGGSTGDNFDFVGEAGCPAGLSEVTVTSTVDGTEKTIQACEIPAGTLTTDLTLTADNAYALTGTVFVGENAISVPGGQTATLTIEPGTVVFGSSGRDALVVSPGSQLVADGAANAPIIMTSASDLADGAAGATAIEAASDGTAGGDASARGEWGGLVISGLAPINDCPGTPGGTAACTADGEGGSGLYGGDQPNDNSGSLRYVRVQYAGFNFSETNQLNGIAFQGVGDQTVVEYIQVHNNADDGVEFFGGTVDADYVVVTGAGDDSIDWTSGWQGDLQYAVVVQTAGDADRGIEGDNNGDSPDALPRSEPIISNFTFLGADGIGDDGVKLRAGTGGLLLNGVVVNFEGDGVDFDAEGTLENPRLFSILVAENGEAFDSDGGTVFGASDSNVASTGSSLNGLFLGDVESGVTATDIRAVDAMADMDIETTNYIGAFAPGVQSIASSWLDGWTLTAPFPSEADEGCPAGTVLSSRAVPGGRTEARVCTISNPITQDVRLNRGNLYEIQGVTFVGQDAGGDSANPVAGAASATLTIESGVTLFGASGRDALVVSRGSQIEANGTAASPIIMTSLSDVSGTVGPDDRGAWGGLIINGRAPINDCPGGIEGGTAACEADGEGGSGLYGGNDPADDSGNLNYVRVQYAGFNFTETNQLNGIAFQGVGAGTDVDYVQVHNNADDGVEFFGGTVSAKHVVITNAGDDSIDWTSGWTGNLQFAIVTQLTGDETDNAIEADSNGDAPDGTPRSNPTLANLTLIGDGNSNIVLLRAGTDASIYNSILLVADAAGDAAGTGDGIEFVADSMMVVPTFFSTYVVDVENPLVNATGDLFTTANGNVNGEAAGQDSTLTADGTTAALVPGANETAVAATAIDEDADPATENEFFDEADYIGAVEDADDDWYQRWTIGL